jgi:hypothetical protein
MTHCRCCTISYKIIYRKHNVGSSIICKVHKGTNVTEVWIFDRYHADRIPSYISFKSRQGEGRASVHCHVPCSSKLCLPTKASSGAATCPTAPDPASLLERAPVLSRVAQLRTPPPYQGSFWCCHMPHDSGSRLAAREGSGATTAPDHASLLGGGVRHYHVSHEPQRVAGVNS